MLTIHHAKACQGKLVLPPSPDLFCVAAFAAVALHRPMRIEPIQGAPAIRTVAELLTGHADIAWEEDACTVNPLTDSAAAEFWFDSDALPHRDLIVFLALGTRKPVLFRTISAARIEAWTAQAARIGYTLTAVEKEGCHGLSLVPPVSDSALPPAVCENDMHAILGLLAGLHAKRSFQTDCSPTTLFRPLMQALGFPLAVKRDQGGVEKDPLIRRMRLQAGQRLSSQDQLFTITADFSVNPGDGITGITLPGDEVLLGIFIAAKALIHKGSFVIDNAPLDPWALPIFSLVRKMGGKPSQQQSKQTSFGAAGMISIQKFELTGQKTACTPLALFHHHLPAMLLVAAFAEGQSVFRDLGDLRLSEPDQLKQLETAISLLNVKHGDMPDGIVIQGGRDYDGFDCQEPLPAALAGALCIAGLCTMGKTTVNDDTIAARWPGFNELLTTLFEYRA